MLSRRVVLYSVELPVPLRMLFPLMLNKTLNPFAFRISLPRILQITVDLLPARMLLPLTFRTGLVGNRDSW